MLDTQKYLSLVELDKLVKIGEAPNLKLLQLLVKHHVLRVVYQNLDLLVQQRCEVDLTPSALLERLLVENRGGMCYETSELMLRVLLEFKFDARRVATFCLANLLPYTDGAVDNHHIIIVHLEGKMYLVDVGFGYNSIREPLEFSCEKTEDKFCLPFEKYRLEANENHYAVRLWVKDAWAPFYRFRRPLIYVDDELCMKKYRDFLSAPEAIPIRDSVLKIGIVTETGRRGFSCKFDSKNLKGSPPYTQVLIHNSDTMQSDIVDYARFRQGIQNIVKVPVEDDHFEKS